MKSENSTLEIECFNPALGRYGMAVKSKSELKMFLIGIKKFKKNNKVIQTLYDESKKLTQYVLLDTCQRVEIYADQTESIPLIKGTYLIASLVDIYRHLFNVTAGLKSPILGETEIQGQVKIAYAKAINSNQVSTSIHNLFQTALAVGKRVRRETSFSEGALTYAGLVLKKLKSIFPELENKRIGLIGYGQLIKDFIYLARKYNLMLSLLITKSIEKIDTPYPFDVIASDSIKHLSVKLKDIDIVISATSDSLYMITPTDLPKNKSLCIIDLASPPDIHPQIHSIKGITLVDLDQLTQLQETTANKRLAEVEKVNFIIDEECSKINPAIKGCSDCKKGCKKEK